MDITLSWNNHIYILIKKLSTACYIIRSAKTYMSVITKSDLLCFFHSAMSLELYFGETRHKVP